MKEKYIIFCPRCYKKMNFKTKNPMNKVKKCKCGTIFLVKGSKVNRILKRID